MPRLAGKNALVIGSATGIGRAVCLAFAAEGASVLAADRGLADEKRTLLEAISSTGGPTHVYVWLPSIDDFEAMNSVYDAWVQQGNAPARACVEANPADPRLKVEIQAFAVVP